MSMTSGVIKVESKGDAVWAVYGTPTDAVLIGLAHILRSRLTFSGPVGAETATDLSWLLRATSRSRCSTAT
jgi:broad specificity polyphosphatase/5'/3'-nucleotidase SurE